MAITPSVSGTLPPAYEQEARALDRLLDRRADVPDPRADSEPLDRRTQRDVTGRDERVTDRPTDRRAPCRGREPAVAAHGGIELDQVSVTDPPLRRDPVRDLLVHGHRVAGREPCRRECARGLDRVSPCASCASISAVVMPGAMARPRSSIAMSIRRADR